MTRRKPFQCLITESGCFEIISHKTNKKVGGSSGYIYYRYKKIIGTNGKTRYLKKGAHCFIYEQNYGPIPDGMVVRHRCDNPICINPAHLLVGTQGDNMNDSIIRGRNAFGERNGSAKLKEQDVIAILNSRGITHKELALKYSVARTSITRIKSGQHWKHITLHHQPQT